jgi:hypothetical protein
VEGRILAPPSPPGAVTPRSRAAAEHVPAHDHRADGAIALLDHRGTRVDLTIVEPERFLTPHSQNTHPLMQELSSDTQGVLGALILPGDKPIE